MLFCLAQSIWRVQLSNSYIKIFIGLSCSTVKDPRNSFSIFKSIHNGNYPTCECEILYLVKRAHFKFDLRYTLTNLGHVTFLLRKLVLLNGFTNFCGFRIVLLSLKSSSGYLVLLLKTRESAYQFLQNTPDSNDPTLESKLLNPVKGAHIKV